VESLPKVDKSITFHYCTVRIAAYRRNFFEKTKQIVSNFLCFKFFFKSGQICDFQQTSKSQKCFSFRGASPLWPPIIGASHLYLGTSNSPTPTLYPRKICGYVYVYRWEILYPRQA